MCFMIFLIIARSEFKVHHTQFVCVCGGGGGGGGVRGNHGVCVWGGGCQRKSWFIRKGGVGVEGVF